jgi:hypothetical protein
MVRKWLTIFITIGLGWVAPVSIRSPFWPRVRKSTNDNRFFGYEFWPRVLTCQEPEGLMIWDLDDGRLSGIRGQLHAFILDNDLSADELESRHYAGTIYVDGTHSGGDGRIDDPYQTVTDAYNFIASHEWRGATIKIKTGSYPESITISMPVKLVSWEGTTMIGSGGWNNSKRGTLVEANHIKQLNKNMEDLRC